jgi:hypothetical protein
MTNYYASICPHPGTTTIAVIDGIKIHGTTVSDAYDIWEDDHLIVACASYATSSCLEVPEGFESLMEYDVPQDILQIEWKDYQAPRLHPEFWKALIEAAVTNGVQNISVCCVGSHGRTGTALAALMIVHKQMTAAKAVNYVRKRHCDQAVESHAQIDYLVWVEEWALKEGIIKGRGPRPAVRKPKTVVTSTSYTYTGAEAKKAADEYDRIEDEKARIKNVEETAQDNIKQYGWGHYTGEY